MAVLAGPMATLSVPVATELLSVELVLRYLASAERHSLPVHTYTPGFTAVGPLPEVAGL